MSFSETPGATTVQTFVVPELTVKELLGAIPPHCFDRSFFKSSLHLLRDIIVIGGLLWTAHTFIPSINPQNLFLPHPTLYPALRAFAWGAYSFVAGLFFMGLFVIGHECGHQAYSAHKTGNNIVGFVIHSAIGVPYHSWRISHAKHHAQTSHLTGDTAWIPSDRNDWGLPRLDTEKENLEGTHVTSELQEVFEEILEFSPIQTILKMFTVLFFGWQFYLVRTSKGPKTWQVWTSHFLPREPLFKPHQFPSIVLSDLGIAAWLIALVFATYHFGFLAVFRTYVAPWMWGCHWLILITYLQHTDPSLPHWEASAFTFPRGALSTLDRALMGGSSTLSKAVNWFCASATHGICETHVAHHVCSKIPHYNAWEANAALAKRLNEEGIYRRGNPATWGEMYRVWTQCKFVEDEGEVRFYKNAQGKAASVAVFPATSGVSDSGVDL